MAASTEPPFLHLLRNPKRSGNGYKSHCPCHEDRTPSLSSFIGDDEEWHVKCQAGCDQKAVNEWHGIQRNGKGNGTLKREVVKTYPYHDAEGNVLYRKVRFVPKGFILERPDGKGGWIPGLADTPRVLYRLPELREDLALGKTVFVVEGEKDVDSLRKIGIPATCNPNGADEWRDSYTLELEDADVVPIADKDEPGRKHAAAVKAALEGRAQSVNVLELPGDGVKDASDWLEAGGTAEQLHKLADDAPEWNPESIPSSWQSAPPTQSEPEEWQPCNIREWLHTEPLPPDWVIVNMLEKGDVGMITAAGGLGKTWWAILLAISCACGVALLKSFAPPRPLRVLMLTAEETHHKLHRRFKHGQRVHGLERYESLLIDNLILYAGKADHLVGLRNGIPTRTKRYQWLVALVAELEIDLVIIDPKAQWDGGAENETASATAFVRALQDLIGERAACLLVHHIRKSSAGELDADAARGSSALRDACRWAAAIVPLSEAEAKNYGVENPRGFAKFDVVKANGVASLPEPIYFARGAGGLLSETALTGGRNERVAQFIARWLAARDLEVSYRSLRQGRKKGEEVIDELLSELRLQFSKKLTQSQIAEAVDAAVLSGILVLNTTEKSQVLIGASWDVRAENSKNADRVTG